MIVALLFFATSLVMARDVEETFLRANKYYQENKLVEAKESYEKINKKGTATWYNLGNCHYKLDNHVDALVCWRKSEQQAEVHELGAIAYNISAVENKLGKHTKLTWYMQVGKFLLPRSLFMFQIIFLMFLYVLVACVYWYKRGMRYRMVVMALLCMATTISACVLIMKHHINGRCEGVVIASKASLFAGPDEQYHVLCSVDLADDVIIREQRENWCKVMYKDTVGWLPKNCIAHIE